MDDLKAYINSIEHLPMISKDEEKRLSAIIQNSEAKDEVDDAIQTLILANLRLVISRAMKFNDRNPQVGLMDLISDGNMSLTNAARRYKAAEASFGTYATYCIDRCFFKSMRSHDVIRVPTNQNDKIIKLNRLQLPQKENLNDDEIMEALGIGEYALDMLKDAKNVRFMKSLDAPITNTEGESITLLGLIANDDPTADYYANLSSVREYIEDKMDILTDRERTAIRSFFLEGQECTYKDAAKRMGISRERCRQLVLRALHKMRRRISG